MSCARALAALLLVSLGSARADKPRITVHAYEGEDPRGVQQAEAIDTAVGQVLASDSRLAFQSIPDLLTPPGEIPRLLGQADVAVIDAEASFAEMDLDKAKNLLKGAIETYEKYLPQLGARGGGTEPLRDAWLKLAKARFFDGDSNGAREALRVAFVLDPKIEFDKSLFPPQMKKTVIEAKLLFDTLGPGKISIDSDPPGATVFLNGVQLQLPTPTEAAAAPPGPNYLTFQRRGFQSLTAVVENAGGTDGAQTVQALSRWPHNPFQPLDRARSKLDESEQPPHLLEAAQAFQRDLLLLVRTQPVDAGVRVSAYLYDARPNRVLKRSTRTVPETDVVAAAQDLAGDVLLGVRLDGIWQPPAPPKKLSLWARFTTKTKTDFKRFYHSKYFWYVVGGVAGAVVVGTAVGAGVGAGSQHHPTPGEAVVLIGGR